MNAESFLIRKRLYSYSHYLSWWKISSSSANILRHIENHWELFGLSSWFFYLLFHVSFAPVFVSLHDHQTKKKTKIAMFCEVSAISLRIFGVFTVPLIRVCFVFLFPLIFSWEMSRHLHIWVSLNIHSINWYVVEIWWRETCRYPTADVALHAWSNLKYFFI